MMMESIWSRTAQINIAQPGRLPARAQAAVIGAGMAGILTARRLKDAGMDVVVLEADRLGGGQTKGTTAKITLQHGLCYAKLAGKLGWERAGKYAEANRAAVEEYRKMVRRGHIGCDFRDCSAYLYSETGTEALEEEFEAAKRLGIEAELTARTELPFQTKGALAFRGQAAFHPLKFLERAAEGIPVYEHTRVTKVRGQELVTDAGSLEAEHVVFATHYPFVNFPGFYFMKQHQERSYVIAYRNAPVLDGLYYGIDEGAVSLRSAGELLLVGGEGHRTGEDGGEEPFARLSQKAGKLFPGCEETARWAAQDCMPLDGVPYIGRYSRLRPNWYVETGFHKWGMTGAMAAAMTVEELITKGASPYEEVFSPMRGVGAAGFPALCREAGHAAKGLAKGVFGRPRCPHMGCLLEWNREERTWDCPCHGSRFWEDGTLIDNPAQTNAPVRDAGDGR